MIWGAVYCCDNTGRGVESLASKYSLRLIRLQPHSLLPPPAPSSGRETHPAGVLAARAASSPLAASSADGDAGPAPSPNPNSVTVPRRFEPPPLLAQAPSAQILLQPDVPPIVPVRTDIRLPALLLWKMHPALPAPPPRKIFVPHRRPDDPARLNLPEPPALEPPNNEAQITALALSSVVDGPSPLLPRPPGSTAPIRTQGRAGSTPIPQIAPSLSTDANGLNVLSIPEIPMPPAGVFQLPTGNQAGPSVASGGQPGPSRNSAGSGSAGSTTRFASPAAGAGDDRNASVGGSAGPGAAGQEPSRGSGSPGPGTGMGRSGLSSGQADSGSARNRTVTKVVLPADGHFTLLVESSGSEAFAEAEGILSGRLVYTVYVRTGARKEWILQYCLPQAVERTLPVAGKGVPLEAPFPYVILRPDLAFGPDIDYLIVHGIVTTLGRLAQLSYVIAPEEQVEKDLLFHSLQQWQFRPGKLDRQPIVLEILLIIPRDRD